MIKKTLIDNLVYSKFLIQTFILFFINFPGLECFSCVNVNENNQCIDDPRNELNPIVDCDKGEDTCCTITRQEYLEGGN